VTVLVDTTIWSLAIRRRHGDLNAREKDIVEEWVALVEDGQAALVGPIRQEILSGIRRPSDFDTIRRQLSAFVYLPLLPRDYDQAAAFFNTCRTKGLTGTAIDLLICAVASRVDVSIFTTDADFDLYAKHLGIRLH
jgi:predicted nucleic acid-binding protein